ncbi:TraG family conjugative transposon ATPase [Robiginitalea sp. M366]|uniref:TraG family conjugative transposon ATPase n=1 Tax=Robiginitalea aestuariiviva TaxID=3036903 RepID=UPI00240DE57E|nr:TraG family conjugative transposon ATPase [Robiginitalea aestuariiviva]MDG1573302.1 TraG family conjugative transposon ATPase [Robiginitalea aestuariiviva]
MKPIELAGFHPILTIQDDVVFASNGNLVLPYQVDLPEIYTLSEGDFEALHATWLQAIKGLPAGTVIHKQDVYLKTAFESSALPGDTFLAKATRRHFQGRPFMDHTCYLFFIHSKNKALNNPAMVNPFRKISTAIPSLLEESLKTFVRQVEDSVAYLNNSKKVQLTRMDAPSFREYTRSYFNGFSHDVDTDILLDKNLEIGDRHWDILSVNSELCFGDTVSTSLPNNQFASDAFGFHQGFLEGLGLQLDENHLVNQIIYLDDKAKWRKILERRIDELKKSSRFGSQNAVILAKVEDILERINEDEQSRIIRGHLNIHYWDTMRSRLGAIASKVKAEFKELDIRPYQPKGANRSQYYINSYPCYATLFRDSDLYVSDLKHALCPWIHTRGYRSDETGILFQDRVFNIPVRKDVWDETKKRIKARNFAIFAPTGEGKSFLANNILRQYFEAGVRLVIIDLGGSYTKFAQLYPEQFVILRYQEGTSLGINPFYVVNPEAVDADHLEDLCQFLLELLACDTPMERTGIVALKKVLRHYYLEIRDGHSMSSFVAFIRAQQNDLLRQLDIHPSYLSLDYILHMLSEYVGDGLYGFLFALGQDQTYRLEDKRLIIFELDQVRDNRELLAVMLKLIKTAIQRTIWKNRSEKGIILFDEFAKQLKFDNVLESVEFYYQAIRKQNGAIGIILQSINQLPKNHTSASILENTQVVYSLHNEKGYDELKQRLNLSDHDENQLYSMRNNLSGPRKYTELFLKIGKESNVYRLEVPPEAYAAYLTDGAESEALQRLFEASGNMQTAITQFISSTKT